MEASPNELDGQMFGYKFQPRFVNHTKKIHDLSCRAWANILKYVIHDYQQLYVQYQG